MDPSWIGAGSDCAIVTAPLHNSKTHTSIVLNGSSLPLPPGSAIRMHRGREGIGLHQPFSYFENETVPNFNTPRNIPARISTPHPQRNNAKELAANLVYELHNREGEISHSRARVGYVIDRLSTL